MSHRRGKAALAEASWQVPALLERTVEGFARVSLWGRTKNFWRNPMRLEERTSADDTHRCETRWTILETWLLEPSAFHK